MAKLQQTGERAQFERGRVRRYGREAEVLFYSFVCLWWVVSKRPIQVVIVRDPVGKEHDDYFFTTDVEMSVVAVVEEYAGRWGAEEVIREMKQSMGLDEVQGWSARAVLRQVPVVVVVHALVQVAYWQSQEAHERKELVSFGQMLTQLRLAVWSERIKESLAKPQSVEKIEELLEEALRTAA